MVQTPIKIEGIKAMRLSEQNIRKGSSILTLQSYGFSPAPHRTKDVIDYFATQEALITSKTFGQKKLLANQ